MQFFQLQWLKTHKNSKNAIFNVVYEYPKCKAGAGNGAGDFFVDKKCTEKLYLNKDMNITATCIKQQVEGSEFLMFFSI